MTAVESPAAQEFLLPDVGEGLTEAEIVAWRVAVGDTVAVNDVLVEIETVKSVVELPSPYAGQVLALCAAEGETVEVGAPIIRISGLDAESSTPNLVGYGPRKRELRRRSPRAESTASPTLPPAPVAAKDGDIRLAEEPSRPRAKPVVRRLARDLGVDLAAVAPTGPDGSVSREDVLAVAQGGEAREPVVGVRKQMAAAMVASAFTAPHATVWTTVDAAATVEMVSRIRRRDEFAGIKASPLLVIARACLLALRRTPLLNSTWDDDAREVVVKRAVHLGIAAATPRGLVVPNIKDAGSLSLPDLARALEELATTAREGRTAPADLTGGSFTITNAGVFGIDSGTPIINPGESAILCVGAIRPQPWVVDNQVVSRPVVTLSLSFDHRHIDGATAGRFLSDIAGIVTDPATSLLF